MRQKSGSKQKVVSDPKRSIPKIAQNMVELSNIEYLFKFVNYVLTDPHTMFQNCLQKTNKNQSQAYFTTKKPTKLPEIVPFVNFTEQEITYKEKKCTQIIKQLTSKSINAKPPTQSLSKQQLLHIASSKIMEGKAKELQEIAKSRRSFEYIEKLKTKITSAIDSSKQLPTEQMTIELNEIIRNLQLLEEKRTSIKLQLYYLQKEDVQPGVKFQAFKLLETNLFQAKQLYTLYLSQVDMNTYTKAKILNDTQNIPSVKHLNFLPNNRSQSIMKLEKFLNSILIDEREMNILKYELGIS